MRIGIIAALPGELKPLVRGWQKLPVVRGSGIRMWQHARGVDEVVAVCAGMGAAAARRAFVAAEFAGSLDRVMSVGWAGALTGEAIPGSAYGVAEVVDTQTGERFKTSEEAVGIRLVTTAAAAGEVEKRRLAASYKATLVDMEAATLARLARMRDIPFDCVKAVSDGYEADLPDLNLFIDVDGRLRTRAFVAHVSLRPRHWGPVAQLGRMSAKAALSLAAMLTLRLNLEGERR